MLRRMLTIGASGLALALAAGSASATPRGWYLSLSGGVNMPEGTTFVVTPAGGPLSAGAYDFDTGWAVMGAVGYRWDSNWRLEFELAFRHNDWERTAAPLHNGELSQFTQMINVAYDIELTDRLNLSLGAGVGGNLISVDVNAPVGLSIDDDYVLAGQLMASLSYQVSNRMELFLDYRYLVSDDSTHSYAFPAPPRALSFENTNHTVMVGLRYDLSPDAEPVQPFVQPPPPPPPPVAKQYIVFFGWNKSNLTADAQSTVAQAAATAKQIGAASILVVGHTDTSGGARYNQKLSERRANTVANELVRNGISPESISAMGKGETELLIQTGDSMREPQNRRVEINL